MTSAYKGGPVLQNVEVTTVYLNINVELHSGQIVLRDPKQLESKCLTEDFVADIVDSTYLDLLGTEFAGPQAPKIGRGRLLGSVSGVLDRVVPWDQNVSDLDFESFLQGQIDSGNLPQPNPNTCFMLVYSSEVPNSLIPPGSEIDGYHTTFISSGQKAVPYIVLPAPVSTILITHEIAEVITDPYFSAWGEIADPCEDTSYSDVPFHNARVSTFMSPLQNRCVGPVDDGLQDFGTNVKIEMKGARDCAGLIVEGAQLSFSVSVTKNGTPVSIASVEWSYRYPPRDWHSFVGPILSLTADRDEGIEVLAKITPTGSECVITSKELIVNTISQDEAQYYEIICTLIRRVRYLKDDFRLNPIWSSSRDFLVDPVSSAELEVTREFAQRLHDLTDALSRFIRPTREGSSG